MKGMTFEEYGHIVLFIQEHHRFGFRPKSDSLPVTENGFKHHQNIKYIDSIYDTLASDVWCVKLRGPDFNFRFSTHDELPENFPYDELYDWVMAFLNGAWKPSVNVMAIISEKI